MAPNIIYDPVGLARGFTGGLCIGLVSTSLMYLTGKTLGVSGILGALVRALRLPTSSAAARTGSAAAEPAPYWQLSFISGMLVSGGVLLAVQPPAEVFGAALGQHWAVPLVGGCLVGFGTRLGQGCTSGHGVSGLPRLSPRSLVNVLSFMGAGALAAGLSRASFSRAALYSASGAPAWDLAALFVVPLAATAGALLLLQTLSGASSGSGSATPAPPAAEPPAAPAPAPSALALGAVGVHGLAFGLALGLSGMCDPAKVLRFLDFAGDGGWDPQLMLVMGGAVLVNAFTYRYLALRLGAERPPLAAALAGGAGAPGASATFAQLVPYGPAAPANSRITWELVLGGALFGAGWGLGGVCPGPAIVDYVSGGSHFGVAIPAILAGMAAQEAGQARGWWGGGGCKGGGGGGGGSSGGGGAPGPAGGGEGGALLKQAS